jgi:hypothetical protein
VRAAIAAGVHVKVAITVAGSRQLERRVKRWHKTGQFCPICRAARGGRGCFTHGLDLPAASPPRRPI